MTPYSPYSAPIGSKVVHYIGNREPFGTEPQIAIREAGPSHKERERGRVREREREKERERLSSHCGKLACNVKYSLWRERRAGILR